MVSLSFLCFPSRPSAVFFLPPSPPSLPSSLFLPLLSFSLPLSLHPSSFFPSFHSALPSLLSSTPAVKYNQRQNSGSTVCTLNEPSIPQTWRGNTRARMRIGYYDNETALKEPYQYMFQKVSEKALGKCSLSVICPASCSLIPRPSLPSCYGMEAWE